MTNEELKEYGYVLTTFGGDEEDTCDKCEKGFIPQGELFFYCTGDPEYPHEGDYYCRSCAAARIRFFESFVNQFSMNESGVKA